VPLKLNKGFVSGSFPHLL